MATLVVRVLMENSDLNPEQVSWPEKLDDVDVDTVEEDIYGLTDDIAQNLPDELLELAAEGVLLRNDYMLDDIEFVWALYIEEEEGDGNAQLFCNG